MKLARTTGVCFVLAILTPAASPQNASPYAGLETRTVKALSDQQIADLKAGRGMGMALAAELNGFPGPLHVLELADKLELTAAQRAKIETLFADMTAEAVPIGERLIGQEADLNHRFASRTITPATLAASTDAIGRTQGALRNAHLKYHLVTLEILTADQTRRYAELRGYGASGAHQRRH